MALQVGVGSHLVALKTTVAIAVQLAEQPIHALLKLLQLICSLDGLERTSRHSQHKGRHQSDHGRLQGHWAQTMQPECADHFRIPGKL